MSHNGFRGPRAPYLEEEMSFSPTALLNLVNGLVQEELQNHLHLLRHYIMLNDAGNEALCKNCKTNYALTKRAAEEGTYLLLLQAECC